MNQEVLTATIARLLTKPKGILAIDESDNTCKERFEKLGIELTEENRRRYRELLITAPGIEQYISGYILFDETIRQKTGGGESFTDVMKSKGLEVGIKVDQGTEPFFIHPDEKITKGILGLKERLAEYKSCGATFAKWRSVYKITDNTPTAEGMKKSAEIFAEYALLCQEAGIVPIVEPEVLMDGDHTIEKCFEVTVRNLEVVFKILEEKLVFLPGMILKTSMVLPGKDSKVLVDDKDIAKKTVECLKAKVPKEVGGIVFLSGGMEDIQAVTRLNEMHKLGDLPWPLTFSYGRAIQNGALLSFSKSKDDAQTLLLDAAHNSSLASMGEYPSAPQKPLDVF